MLNVPLMTIQIVVNGNAIQNGTVSTFAMRNHATRMLVTTYCPIAAKT